MAPARQPCRILVVDDDAGIRDTLRDILESEGYPVLTADNAARALALVEAAPPQVIVLDMRMPVASGWDFAAALRARGVAIPILVLTAARDPEAVAREIGAADFVGKPFDVLDLLEKVAKLDAEA
jgi:CheY-like chemotaxis protein